MKIAVSSLLALLLVVGGCDDAFDYYNVLITVINNAGAEILVDAPGETIELVSGASVDLRFFLYYGESTSIAVRAKDRPEIRGYVQRIYYSQYIQNYTWLVERSGDALYIRY